MAAVDKESVKHQLFVLWSPYIAKFAIFSVFINILVLTPSWYMLEVYDRVINSKNHQTLLMISLMVVIFYAVLEFLEWVRARILKAGALRFDALLRERIFNAAFLSRLSPGQGNASQAFSDLKAIRDAADAGWVGALVDTPLSMLALFIIYLIHPKLGLLATAGILFLLIFAYLNDRKIQPYMKLSSENAVAAQTYASGAIKNAQAVESMGMMHHILGRWQKFQNGFLLNQAMASDAAGRSAAVIKVTQIMQGSLVLGLGCLLALGGELAMGSAVMIVSSILAARVITPMVQVVMQWRQILTARESLLNLIDLLERHPEPEPAMPLPAPRGDLLVDHVSAGAPGSSVMILRNVSFALKAGESLAIIGPSASGKTSLARLLVGLWPATSGKVRLDGVDIFSWNKEELGPHVGYLPQRIELFEGTVAENIARFGEVDVAKVEAAIRLVGLDDWLKSLPQGLDANIGDEGVFLSGGQRQRIAIARAVYGMPKYIVMDEPNSSLDDAGDDAFARLLRELKLHGSTVIVITHRKNLLAGMDKVLVLVDGEVKAFDASDKVLAAMQQAAAPKPVANNLRAAV